MGPSSVKNGSNEDGWDVWWGGGEARVQNAASPLSLSTSLTLGEVRGTSFWSVNVPPTPGGGVRWALTAVGDANVPEKSARNSCGALTVVTDANVHQPP